MKQKVLIVDDSSLARRTMRLHLEDMGYEVQEASDGTQALERFHLGRPDLVILDLVMSGMYGLEVLATLKEMNPDVRVLIATADVQTATADQVRSAGAVGILNKPVNRDKLIAAVGAVLTGGHTWN